MEGHGDEGVHGGSLTGNFPDHGDEAHFHGQPLIPRPPLDYGDPPINEGVRFGPPALEVYAHPLYQNGSELHFWARHLPPDTELTVSVDGLFWRSAPEYLESGVTNRFGYWTGTDLYQCSTSANRVPEDAEDPEIVLECGEVTLRVKAPYRWFFPGA
jgi:hypothetical protein